MLKLLDAYSQIASSSTCSELLFSSISSPVCIVSLSSCMQNTYSLCTTITIITYLAFKLYMFYLNYIDRFLVYYSNFCIGMNTLITFFVMHLIFCIALTYVSHFLCHLLPFRLSDVISATEKIDLYSFIKYIYLKYYFL